MMKLHLKFTELFGLTERDVQAANLREAQIRREEHAYAAEYHQALADMYDTRVKRIEGANQDAIHHSTNTHATYNLRSAA